MLRFFKNLLASRFTSKFGGQSIRAESSVPRSLEQALEEAGLSMEAWIGRIRQERRLYVDIPEDRLDYLRIHYPQWAALAVSTADTILTHFFDLLGSGPYMPIDQRRPPHDGYTPIDWYLDPVSGLRFPEGIPCKEWDLYAMRPGNADIKLPWELARCQHWVALGQAWRLTADARYAREIAFQLEDFMQANPVGIGINWTCTMDVAIRAANWALGLSLIRACDELPDHFWPEAGRALFAHGLFIQANFENHYEVTSNHYLSNIVGLHFLASLFQDLPLGGEWDRFCRASLEEEIEKQILDDGADFESSIPYHRLVLELFLASARLAAFHNRPLSPSYLKKLRLMAEYLLSTLRPDGLMPVTGDADDGRFHIFSQYGSWNPQDGRHILGPAAFLLDESTWLACAGPEAVWECTWWGFEILDFPPADQPLPPVGRLYPLAGNAVFRKDRDYLLITNARVGTQGFGNHKHNDQLAFELHLDGIPLLIDPGSHVYTADPGSRNLFRGTGYHNTLCIDGVEQNEIRPEWLFRMFETARAEHLSFEDSASRVDYVGRHIGYERLPEPVTHTRAFRLLKPFRTLLVADILEGKGSHLLEWHFHLAPEVSVRAAGEGEWVLHAKGREFYLKALEPDLEASISPARFSPSYGVTGECTALDISTRTTLSPLDTWRFVIGPRELLSQPGAFQEMDEHFNDMLGGYHHESF